MEINEIELHSFKPGVPPSRAGDWEPTTEQKMHVRGQGCSRLAKEGVMSCACLNESNRCVAQVIKPLSQDKGLMTCAISFMKQFKNVKAGA